VQGGGAATRPAANPSAYAAAWCADTSPNAATAANVAGTDIAGVPKEAIVEPVSFFGRPSTGYSSQAHTPPSGTKPPPTGSGLSGQQNADTPDVSTHAAL
jgi:hypothetical protein